MARDTKAFSTVEEAVAVRVVVPGLVRTRVVINHGVQAEIVQIRERESRARIEEAAALEVVEVRTVTTVGRVEHVLVP